MAAFTASQASVINGSKVVTISSGESVANVNKGDFLVLANAIVEINRAYIGADNKGYFELVKNWPNSNQSNQPCVVIPTTGQFKTAVEALTKANVLVNNNFKAMQDWQTKTGTVTFENNDGTTTTVKTLKQIENEAQAQMEATHPHPWAMRKVEFEAIRAANNEKYAASGFVYFGKHYTDTQWDYISSGLYFRDLSNIMSLGRNDTLGLGDSKTTASVINVSGVITELNHKGSGRAVDIKFPPAEDGTRTYDSATGVSVTHATPTIAFASETETNKVVTDRVDMWGFEAFLREINDNDPFVYKYGLIQSSASNINGVATVDDNERPITYFAWYTGDTTSRGKGVNWQTATEAQRTAIASDPANNIYFDDSTGKFYQWCIRGRSFAGAGNGDWALLDSSNPVNYGQLRWSSVVNKNMVYAQGNRDLPADAGTSNSYYTANNSAGYGDPNNTDLGIYSSRQESESGYDYMYVAGTVKRLNQGAYHPSFNPLGTAYFLSNLGSNTTWFSNLIKDIGKASNRLDCFDKARLSSGYLASGSSARLDGRYYDGIYASGDGGVCRDMRYSAWGLKAEDFAEAELKIKSGEYRGLELPSQIRPMMTWTASSNTSGSYFPCLKSSVIFLNKHLWEEGIDTTSIGNFKDENLLLSGKYCSFERTGSSLNEPVYNCIVVNKTNGKFIVFGAGASNALYFSSSDLVTFYPFFADYADVVTNDSVSTNLSTWLSSNITAGDELIMYAQLPADASVAGEYTHTEVIASPLEFYQCDDLKDGWVGSWNPTIPDGTSKAFPFTRPVSDSRALFIGSQDQGATWQAPSTLAVNNTLNQRNPIAYVSNQIFVVNYKTKARMTKDATNSVVYGGEKGVGNVLASSSHEYARDLGFSLTSNINVSNTNSDVGNLTLINNVFDNDGKLSTDYLTEHNAPLTLEAPNNNSPAFKALNYNVVENQQGFINYAYTELHYDATAGDWGDDGKIHLADNQTTMPDENGHTVLVGTARCVEPIGWLKNDK